MTVGQHMIFLLAVALATYAQTMTGFAFGLVLLGLASLFALAPLPDMSNTVSILTLINALVAIGRNRPQVDWSMLRPALCSSLIGVALGVGALGFIDRGASVWLQWLLGLTILVCAFMLVLQARQLKRVSGKPVFVSLA